MIKTVATCDQCGKQCDAVWRSGAKGLGDKHFCSPACTLQAQDMRQKGLDNAGPTPLD